ncbi:CoA-binding protein [Panacagrimonas sp.]|uniref:CoA-binding protein n=1 Tax=Panacagrimonas sp. TaxID=2480088 RepID=UPI003B52059D
MSAARVIDDAAGIAALIGSVRRIAVLGIKTAQQARQPAYYVPEYLAQAGFEVIPVPVYFPEVREILGRPVLRALRDIRGTVDLVNVFRRSEQVADHLDDLLACAPRAVWMQLGIRDDAVAARLVQAGIDVVQDRCLMVEHRRLV